MYNATYKAGKTKFAPSRAAPTTAEADTQTRLEHISCRFRYRPDEISSPSENNMNSPTDRQAGRQVRRRTAGRSKKKALVRK